MFSASQKSPLPLSASQRRLRFAVVLATALLACGVIGWALWEQDLRYARPTPRPPALQQPGEGSLLPLLAVAPELQPVKGDHRPVLLHFFNPECPCSRFAVEHLRQLHGQFRDKVRFIAVLQADTAESVQRDLLRAKAGKMLGEMETIDDATGALAQACGVYATPQAVILSSENRLLFRGNYNAGRYCDDPASEYARLALVHILAGNRVPAMPLSATESYGCELPGREQPSLSAKLPFSL